MTRAPASWVTPSISPSTWAGTPDSMRAGGSPSRAGHMRRTRSWLAPMPPEVTMTACARSENSPTTVRELATPRAAALGSSTSPSTPSTTPDVTDQGGDPMAEPQVDPAPRDGLPHAADEGLQDPGPGAPRDVETRHRVAVAAGERPATLGPLHEGEQPHPLGAQPGPLLAGREVDVRLGPLARPVVLVAVEAGRAQPVLPGQLVGVVDAAAGAAPGCSTRNRPPKDQNAWPPSEDSGSWSTTMTRRPASASSAAATRPARPAPTTTTSASAGMARA